MKEQVITFLDKKKMTGKEIMIVIIIIGMILAVLAIPTGKSSEEETPEAQQVENMSIEREAYEEQLEERLESVLCQMEGVGRVEVMITMEASAREVIEKDASTEQSYNSESTEAYSDSSVKKDESTVYADTEEGSIPYVVQEIYPQVEGVLVVAEGGDNSSVILAITDAIQALFGVDVHKIKIVKMNTN